MNTSVKFEVAGLVISKGRPKLNRCSGAVYTPEKTATYENLIKLEYRRQCKDKFFPAKTPISVNIIAILPIPTSKSNKIKQQMEAGQLLPTVKPDFDNIIKITADALNKVAYADDNQIVSCSFNKYYGYKPKLIVTLKEVDANSNAV